MTHEEISETVVKNDEWLNLKTSFEVSRRGSEETGNAVLTG